jgi:hypothetical protein
MKIHPVGAELLYADGQTDVTKFIVVFLQFCEGAQNYLLLSSGGEVDAMHVLQVMLETARFTHY